MKKAILLSTLFITTGQTQLVYGMDKSMDATKDAALRNIFSLHMQSLTNFWHLTEIRCFNNGLSALSFCEKERFENFVFDKKHVPALSFIAQTKSVVELLVLSESYLSDGRKHCFVHFNLIGPFNICTLKNDRIHGSFYICPARLQCMNKKLLHKEDFPEKFARVIPSRIKNIHCPIKAHSEVVLNTTEATYFARYLREKFMSLALYSDEKDGSPYVQAIKYCIFFYTIMQEQNQTL